MEPEEFVAHIQAQLFGLGLQSAQIASAKLWIWMVLLAGWLVQLIYAPWVRLQILLILRVHRQYFSVSWTRRKERAYEELRKSIDSESKIEYKMFSFNEYYF